MRTPTCRGLLLLIPACAAAPAPSAQTPPVPAAAAATAFRAIALPGASAPVSLDYLAYERGRGRVWVPVGDTGSVDVYDPVGGTFVRVDGFAMAERERDGHKRIAGPSSVAVGDGFAFVGDRATDEVCPVEASTLRKGPCLKLPSSPDGVAYVASRREVWVTTPSSNAVVVLDASRPGTLTAVGTVTLDGRPEGYASDPRRGVFYTNLEDRNATVAVDLATRAPKATLPVDCVAADVEGGFVFVACTDHLVVLDPGHGGAQVGSMDTGPGVDNIDWLAGPRLLYAAAGKAGKLTIAHVDDAGRATLVAAPSSAAGVRNVVAGSDGSAYAADAQNARLLVFPSPGAAAPAAR